jgi:uncharacterized protein (DUF983 family)
MLEITWDSGRKVSFGSESSRNNGFIDCPKCGETGLYYEQMAESQICVECGTDYEKDVAKPIITVSR